jgi:uncharacterized membrane protein YkvA (DUF1232 family)
VSTSSEPMRQGLTRKIKASAGRLWRQFRTLRRAVVHPGVPWYAKTVCGLAVAYIASPIQLIPNFIPVIGQLDDVLVIALSLRLLKRCCPPSVLEDCQKDTVRPSASGESASVPVPVSSDIPEKSSSQTFCP